MLVGLIVSDLYLSLNAYGWRLRESLCYRLYSCRFSFSLRIIVKELLDFWKLKRPIWSRKRSRLVFAFLLTCAYVMKEIGDSSSLGGWGVELSIFHFFLLRYQHLLFWAVRISLHTIWISDSPLRLFIGFSELCSNFHAMIGRHGFSVSKNEKRWER